MNIILNDTQRYNYRSAIAEMEALCPALIARKISRANVQQAFVFDEVRNLSNPLKSELLCVGCHEDTAYESLLHRGYNVVGIDPVINVSLDTFFTSNDKKFDVIFSTSVIEHVEDDDKFIKQICQLLKPGGYAVLTCDFNDDYTLMRLPKPNEDYRLYTQYDLLIRFRNILNANQCEIYGDIDYSPEPDFQYAGCKYTFATYVFQKNN